MSSRVHGFDLIAFASHALCAIAELAHLRAQYEAHGKQALSINTSTAGEQPDSGRPSSAACSTTTTPTDDHSQHSPPSPGVPDIEEESTPWVSPDAKLKTMSEIQFGKDVTAEELVLMFKDTDSLEEQGDILHYLAYTKGISWDTGLGTTPHHKVAVKDLLKDLYEKACQVRTLYLLTFHFGERFLYGRLPSECVFAFLRVTASFMCVISLLLLFLLCRLSDVHVYAT